MLASYRNFSAVEARRDLANRTNIGRASLPRLGIHVNLTLLVSLHIEAVSNVPLHHEIRYPASLNADVALDIDMIFGRDGSAHQLPSPLTTAC